MQLDMNGVGCQLQMAGFVVTGFQDLHHFYIMYSLCIIPYHKHSIYMHRNATHLVTRWIACLCMYLCVYTFMGMSGFPLALAQG